VKDLRRGNPHGKKHVGCGLEVLVNSEKVPDVVGDAEDTGDAFALSFLGQKELFNVVVVDQAQVGVGIKKFHGLSTARKKIMSGKGRITSFKVEIYNRRARWSTLN
jgi:hypothetical protein